MYLATDDGSNSTKGRVINDECSSSSSSSSCSSTLSRSIRLICVERKGFSLFFFYFSFLCANLFASFMIVFIIFVHTIELYSWFGLFITHTPRLCSCCSISSYIENSFSLSAISSRRLSLIFIVLFASVNILCFFAGFVCVFPFKSSFICA